MSIVLSEKISELFSTKQIVELACNLCRIPSPFGEEGLLAEYIAENLSGKEIDVYLQTVVSNRFNVIARTYGKGNAPPLLLVAHLDTSVSKGWNRDPFEPRLENGRIYAGGITDMKAGLAAAMTAIKIASSIENLPGDLILIAAMGHSPTGLGTKYALATEGPWSGYGIFTQSSSLGIHIYNGGVVKFEIELKGRSAHISKMEEGSNALSAAITVYKNLKNTSFTHESSPLLPDLPRVLVGEMHAGSSPSEVPDQVIIRGDVRTVPGMDRHSVQKDLLKVVNDSCPSDIIPSIRILNEQRPFIGNNSNLLIKAIVSAHHEVRKVNPRFLSGLPSESWVIDAVDMEDHGIISVMYGPSEWRYIPEEWSDIKEMTDAAKIYLGTRLILE